MIKTIYDNYQRLITNKFLTKKNTSTVATIGSWSMESSSFGEVKKPYCEVRQVKIYFGFCSLKPNTLIYSKDLIFSSLVKPHNI